MGFVSDKDRRQRDQTMTLMQEYVPDSTWGETYQAMTGMFIDEDLPIVSPIFAPLFSPEGREERKATVERLIDEGKLDRKKYTATKGRGGVRKFDYNAAAADFEEIKDDATLEAEYAEVLRQRREYGQDIVSRGPLTAKLAAGMTFMLDPTSWVTAPLAFSTAGYSGLKAIGVGALKYGAAEGAVEAAVQPLVYGYKQDIDSPYEWQDAIENIGYAAAGAGLIGGGAVGIKETISAIRQNAKKLPQNDETAFADSQAERLEIALEDNPLRKEAELILDEDKTTEAIKSARIELIGLAGSKMAKGDEIKLKNELIQIQNAIKKESEPFDPKEINREKKRHQSKRVGARKAKKQAIQEAELEREEYLQKIYERETIILDRLDANLKYKEAEAELSRINAGITDKYKVYKSEKRQLTSEELIEADKQALTMMEQARNKPVYASDEAIEPPKVEGSPNVKAKENTVMERRGESEAYKQDILKYQQRFGTPKQPPELKGKQVKEKMKIKETGEEVFRKVDAETYYRQTEKRLTQVSKLRECLGA